MAVAKKIPAADQIVVRPDAKGRITLGSMAKGISSFVVSREEDGRLTLEPYKEIPARETWLFENPAAIGKVREGIRDIIDGKVRSRGDFSRFTTDDD